MKSKLPEDSTWNGATKSYQSFKRNLYTWIGGGFLVFVGMVVAYMVQKVNKNETEIYRLDKNAAVIETKLDTIQKSTERIERKLNGYKSHK